MVQLVAAGEMTLFMLLCVQLVVQAGAELVAPHNVTFITLNTNYTLSWAWHRGPAEGDAVTFTTQCIARYKLKSKKPPRWSTVCEATPRTSCDLTPLGLLYQGTFILRVRASANGSHSDWVEREFRPEKHAALGPPTDVRLAPAENNLDVFISDPVTSSNSSMKEHIPTLYYHILYWENSAHAQTRTLSTSANLVTLPSLKPWTWYCVKVQSRYNSSYNSSYNKSSSFTSPVCLQTEGNAPRWHVVVYFLLGPALLLSLCVCCWCYKSIRRTLHPPNQLPAHLKKYLCGIPGSDIPRLLNLDPESELVSDSVEVVKLCSPLDTLLDPPSGLEWDSRYTRQDSSNSGDSGVYSTGGVNS